MTVFPALVKDLIRTYALTETVRYDKGIFSASTFDFERMRTNITHLRDAAALRPDKSETTIIR